MSQETKIERVKHKKRGTTYEVIARGRLQVDGDLDNEKVTVYRGEADGSIWVRPDYEFNDGRFEVLEEPKSDSCRHGVHFGTICEECTFYGKG